MWVHRYGHAPSLPKEVWSVARRALPPAQTATSSSLLFKAEVADQRKVIGGVAEGRQPAGTDLLLGGQVQEGVHLQRVLAVPDVVQGAAALSAGPDLPGGELRLREAATAQFFVGRVQAERRRREAAVHLLGGDGVEVPTDEQRDAAGRSSAMFLDQSVDVAQEVGALRAAKPLPAGPGLQVRRGHAQAFPCAPTPQHGRHGDLRRDGSWLAAGGRQPRPSSTHLIGRNLHGRQPDVDAIQEVVAHVVKEERAAVGAVVALHAQAGRPGLGAEVAAVTQTGQDWPESVIVVVNFLQTQDMRSVAEDLL